FVALAERAGPELRGESSHEFAWWQRLAAEIGNFRAAVAWLRRRGRPEDALRLVGGLDWFWTAYTYVAEGRALLSPLLAEPAEVAAPPLRAAGLPLLGRLANLQDDEAAAQTALEEALALWQHLGDAPRAAETLYALASAAITAGDLSRAADLAAET